KPPSPKPATVVSLPLTPLALNTGMPPADPAAARYSEPPDAVMAHGGSNTRCVAGAPGPPATVLMSHDWRITAAGKGLAREPPAWRPWPSSHPLAAVTARAAARKAMPVRRIL